MAGPSSPRDCSSSPRRSAVLALVLLLAALAGCTAPDGEASPTPTGDSRVTPTPVQSLADTDVDQNETWNRTEALLGVEGTIPSVSIDDYSGGGYAATPFVTAMTGSRSTRLHRKAGGAYVPADDLVLLTDSLVRNTTAQRVELTLAHEYTHAIQDDQGWLGVNDTAAPATDRTVSNARIEGVAMVVQDRYGRRYADRRVEADLSQRYANASTFGRRQLAPYLYGARYVDRRVAETGSLASAAASTPASSEQILHDTEDQPRPLDLRVDAADDWSATPKRPVGELVIRVILRDELSRDRAAAAAHGWGADRVRRIEADGRNVSGYVWVQRWDAPADADEFSAAMEAHLEARRTDRDAPAFGTRRVAPETTVVVLGDAPILWQTRVVAASNASVHVAVGA